MRTIALLVFAFITEVSIPPTQAQNGSATTAIGGFANYHPSTTRTTASAALKSPMRPLESSMFWYDPSLPTVDWIGHGLYGPYVTVALGERFTMPPLMTGLEVTAAWVDSVGVMLDSVTQDSVTIALIPDTLYNVGGGQYFHLINIFDPNVTPLATAVVQARDVHRSQWTTVHFPHVAVPWNFFVVVLPNITSQGTITNAYWLRGDVRQNITRDQELSRSGFIGVIAQTGQEFSAIFDSTFTPAGYSEPLSSNFYIKLYVDAPRNVVNENHSRETNIFPNPADRYLRISGLDRAASVKLIDVLGREVISIGSEESVDVGELEAGRYTAVIRRGESIKTLPVIIAH